MVAKTVFVSGNYYRLLYEATIDGITTAKTDNFKNYKLQVLVLFILSLLVGGLEAANVAAVYPILSAALEGGFGEGNFILSLFKALGWLKWGLFAINI